MCASTNTHQHILDRRMKTTRLSSYMDFWLGGTDGEGKAVDKKRHKHRIMELYGLTEDAFKTSTSLVGDAPGDMIIGSDWNVTYTIFRVSPDTPPAYRGKSTGEIKSLINSKGAYPAAIIRSMEELPDILPKLFFIC